jgi:hypothetical protein
MPDMHVLIGENEAGIALPNRSFAYWLPAGRMMFTPHIPDNKWYRVPGGDTGLVFPWGWTFTDTELDVGAVQYWWANHGPGTSREDFFKNNSAGVPSKTSFSVVARLLKQGGAKEILHVASPKLISWGKLDLINYVTMMIAAAASRPGVAALVANWTTAKK